MKKSFRLCLWQVVLGICTTSVFSISILSTSGPAFSQEVFTQERGIRMRGPKSTDVFPYDRYGPISQRDTLWNIALTVRPDSRLSVYQVMEALYQANPNSFVNNNFNHLVEGRYLKIPSFDRMMSINTAMAKQKSRQDDKNWQKKQPKKISKKAITPQEPSVNKKDLDTVKVEINDQLKKIYHEQQKRLTNIQNDVLDSIDGLQAILKENENLRQRLTSFNSQLGTMQKEVAKGKEIKLQMDDMIRLQQALLEKAQAREQELLLEKQQAALEKDNIFSSLWFIVLMATLPAILILSVVAFIFKRRKKEAITPESKSKKKYKVQSDKLTNEPKADIDEIDELSLDDSDELEGYELGQDELDSLLMEDDEAPIAEDESSNDDDQVEISDPDDDDNNDKSQVSEATEINDIQELDNLDFDELLANIEEESSVAGQSLDFNENLEVGDDFSLADFDNITSNTPSNDNKKTTGNEQDFLSVDSLLSESQDEVSHNEPYDKSNIDVGLNEFPEFTDGVNKIDVDVDENGMAAKLDLAKVYIEIGDQDNAHVILQEVIKQGDNQQQVIAQELLDNL